jgi:SAM-dependent methyltransferase
MDRLKSCVKKGKAIYSVSRRIYLIACNAVGYFNYLIHGTAVQERFWSNRHSGDAADVNWEEIIDGFAHRQALLDIISKYSFGRVLEVGCGFGPNLYLIAQKFPNAEVVGADVNPVRVEKGNEFFRKKGMNVRLFRIKADELLYHFEEKSFDLVFTDSTLIYIGPDKIARVIEDIVKLSRGVIIIKEWSLLDKPEPCGVYYYGKWLLHDFSGD